MRFLVLLSLFISSCSTTGDCKCDKGIFFPEEKVCRDVYFVRNPCELSSRDEVCGCDGNTYANACYAGLAGVKFVTKGKCE